MKYSAKSVRKALRLCGLNHRGTGRRNRSECWTDEEGRSIELVVRGDEVPPGFLKITAAQMESKGICSSKKFKELLRGISH